MSIDDPADFEYEVANRFRTTFTPVGRVSAETPGALIDVLAREPDPNRAAPVSVLQRAFYRLRHVIAQELTIAPAAIRPETRLAALLKRVAFGAWDDKASMAGSVGDLL